MAGKRRSGTPPINIRHGRPKPNMARAVQAANTIRSTTKLNVGHLREIAARNGVGIEALAKELGIKLKKKK